MGENRRILTATQTSRIEQISSQLHESVTPLTIRNWLENFQPEDYDNALTILEKLKYFTIEEIVYEFDKSLEKVLKTYHSSSKYYLIGAGEFGKSGSSLIYFIRQTPTFRKNEGRFKILSHPKKLRSQGLKNGDFLILVDDIIGSGESLVKFYRTQLSSQFANDKLSLNVLAVCIVYMDVALPEIEKINLKGILGTQYIKAFASGSSVFGYRPKMLPIRQMAYNYGKDLFVTTSFESKEKIFHPLGYKSTQALVAFAHSVPNNTLPIIWSTRNGWFPLFPRSGFAKIDRLKQFKKESWLEFTFFSRNKPMQGQGRSIYNNTKNFALFGIIKLKKRKSIVPIICQVLGITVNEYEELIDEGKEKGLFDVNGNLTSLAEQEYESILISNRIQETFFTGSGSNSSRTGVYLPKTFLGKT